MGETHQTIPDQGSGTRPRVSDERLADELRAMQPNMNGMMPVSAARDIALDLVEARATLARYEAALQEIKAHGCRTGYGPVGCECSGCVASGALSSGGSE